MNRFTQTFLATFSALPLALPVGAAANYMAPTYKADFAGPAAASDWTGFYAGIQGGYGLGQVQQSGAFVGTGSFDANGGLFGVTWGTNWQTGNTVIGFEGDVAWASINGATSRLGGFCGGAPATCSAELQWFGTSRVRLGYSFGNWLGYVTGGGAWGAVRAEEGDFFHNGAVGSGSQIRYGWTVGAGVEARINSHWSAKMEYLYVDLGGGRLFTQGFAGVRDGQDVTFKAQMLRAGLNYRLNDDLAGFSFLPILASVPIVGPYARWEGFYLGGTIGGAFGTARQFSEPNFNSGDYDISGFIGGATAGYNWQFGATVVGIEADISYSNIKGETQSSVIGDFCWGNPGTCGVKMNWFGTVRARLGYSWSRHLFYATAGGAYGAIRGYEGDVIMTLVPGPQGGQGSGTKLRYGWTAGAGIDTRINDRWSTRFEYLYVDFGSDVTFDTISLYRGVAEKNVSFRTHVLRTGLNYSFGGGKAVLAYD